MNKRLSAFLSVFSITTCAHALSVPFENINLNPGATLTSGFNFGSFAEIFCYENNLQTVGNVTWPYKGTIKNAPLPLLLSINPAFEGQFSDPVGTLTIKNTTTTPLIVSCVFGF